MDNLKKPDRYDKANEIIQIFLESFLFLSRYQIGLEISMKMLVILSMMVLICCICYKFHKENLKSGGSYINSSNNWIKNKKSINKSHQK